MAVAVHDQFIALGTLCVLDMSYACFIVLYRYWNALTLIVLCYIPDLRDMYPGAGQYNIPYAGSNPLAG